MKKKFLFACTLCIALIYGCQQIELSDDTAQLEDNLEAADDINYSVSLRSATYFVQNVEDNELNAIEPIVYGLDTLLYIANFKDGWQVISGDKRTDPVLASDSIGSLSANDLDNPGVATWLNDMADRILSIKKTNPIVAIDENIKLWTLVDKASFFTEEELSNYYQANGISASSNLKVAIEPIDGEPRLVRRLVSVTSTPYTTTAQRGPLMQTRWGQGDPWNDNNVPYGWDGSAWVECPTGCTAVAMAQIIYYAHYQLNKPTGLYHTVTSTGYIRDSENYSVQFSRSAYNANSPRWDLMPLSRSDWSRLSNSSYVGDLMADIGNRVGMSYSASGSGAWPSTSGFSYYSLSSQKADYSYSTVYTQLNRNMPILMVAYAGKETYKNWFLGKTHTRYVDGHSWVIDGYRKKSKTYTYTYVWELVDGELPIMAMDTSNPYYEEPGSSLKSASDAYPGKREIETRTTTSTYLLMNWGWNGSYNSGEYATGSSSIWTAAGYDFQYKKTMFYNYQ